MSSGRFVRMLLRPNRADIVEGAIAETPGEAKDERSSRSLEARAVPRPLLAAAALSCEHEAWWFLQSRCNL